MAMNNKLVDFVMLSMCDDYCKYPPISEEELSKDQLDEICKTCPLSLFMSLFDK